jgi:hypothetical protein
LKFAPGSGLVAFTFGKNMKIRHCVLITLLGSVCQAEEKIEALPKWYKPNLGPAIHEMGRPALWDAREMKLGDTRFRANIGPSAYQDEDNNDPDYYTIEVEYERNDKSSLVCYARSFKLSDLPDGFIELGVKKVVQYDEATRKVTFKIGKKLFEYTLPQRKYTEQDSAPNPLPAE